MISEMGERNNLDITGLDVEGYEYNNELVIFNFKSKERENKFVALILKRKGKIIDLCDCELELKVQDNAALK